MDTFTPEKRSEIMKKVKSKNTSVEIKFRQELWKSGIRGWRTCQKGIPGKPDVVYKGRKIAIFVDGCFWHGCPVCDRSPKSGDKYWENKINKNAARDKENEEKLIKEGWKVIRFWEHEVNKNVAGCVLRVKELLERFK